MPWKNVVWVGLLGVLTAVPQVTAQDCAPLPAGIVSWWPGDGDPTDIIGGNDATLVGSATLVPSLVNQGSKFGGSQDAGGVGNPGSDLSFSSGLSMDDAFNGTAINTALWNVVISPPGVGTITETNHRLEMVHTTAGVVSYQGLQSHCKVGGDFDVQVGFTLLNWPAQNFHTVRLGAMDLPQGPVGIDGIYRNSYQNENYQMRAIGGVVAEVTTTDSSGKIRLTRTGSTVQGYYWDGANFTLMGTSPTTTDDTRFLIDFTSPTLTSPAGVAIAFDNFKVNVGSISCPRLLFTADGGNDTVCRVSSGTVNCVNVSGGPQHITKTADGAWMYVASFALNGIQVIDAATLEPGPTIGTGKQPRKMVTNAADNRLYVATLTGFDIIDITQLADGTRLNVDIGFVDAPPEVSIGESLAIFNTALVLGTGSGHVLQYDVSGNMPLLTATKSLGAAVNALKFSPDGSKIYAALSHPVSVTDETGRTATGNLIVLRTDTLAVKTVLDLGRRVLFDAEVVNSTYLYVTSVTEVYAVDTIEDVLVNTLTDPQLHSVWGLAADATHVYLADPDQNAIVEVTLGATPSDDFVSNVISLAPDGIGPVGITVVPST
jgi:DNA-binding beta-propeller fold protein YncE